MLMKYNLLCLLLAQVARAFVLRQRLIDAANDAKLVEAVNARHSHQDNDRETKEHKFYHQLRYAKEAMDYLRAFGYALSEQPSESELAEALLEYRRLAGLQRSRVAASIVDRPLIESMRQPRCGNPDAPDASKANLIPHFWHTTKRRYKRYTVKSMWENRLAIDDTLTLYWYIGKATENLTYAEVRASVAATFEKWSSEIERLQMTAHIRPIHVRFIEANSASDADIVLKWVRGNHGDGYDFDGYGAKPSRLQRRVTSRNVVAHTFYPHGQQIDVHIDDDDKWATRKYDAGVTDRYMLPYVLMHEIGHALGLGHSNLFQAIMNPSYKDKGIDDIQLSIDDICSLSTSYRGPSDTCLQVYWFSEMVQPVEKNKHFNSMHRESDLVIESTISALDKNTFRQTREAQVQDGNELVLITKLDEELPDVEIPECNDNNNVQYESRIILQEHVRMTSDEAAETAIASCKFLEKLNRYMMGRGHRTRRSDRLHRSPQHIYRAAVQNDDIAEDAYLRRRKRNVASLFDTSMQQLDMMYEQLFARR